MTINKTNYEAFFLDYHEGNLSPQQVADVLLFIEQHPEHKEEFESFENFSIEDDNSLKFENKSSLKKQIDASNIEDYLIKSVEGTLNTIESNLLSNTIKQYPHFQTDFDLFQKTKLTPDFSIIFENKDELKRVDKMEELLISSVEGLLSKQETTLLNKQLTVDAKLRNDLAIYQQTKVVPDNSIIYKNKEELKRKERKVIPLFYYLAAAASIALLFSLYIIFNDTTSETKLASNPTDSTKQVQNNTSNGLANEAPKNDKNNTVESIVAINNTNQVAVKSNQAKDKKEINRNKKSNSTQNDSVIVVPLTNQQPQNNLVNIEPENKNQQPATNNQQLIINQQATTNNKEAIAKVENKKEKEIPAEFLSLRELAAEKIKEKTLDENTIIAQKKSGKNKKISGWDVAQIVTKGISKLTGRDIEVKPTYNEQGDVTAYALGNGLHVSRGK